MEKTLTLLGIVLLTSCGTIKETEEESSRIPKLKDYESTFRPSDFDQPLSDFFPNSPASTKDSSTSAVSTVEPLELTQGYRVQVFATSSYDDATKMKAAIEGQYVDEWFYLVYDAPTYKLRGGNFIERYEADRFARTLASKGYRDAWVVPERVFKNPGPRPPQPQDTQK